MTYEEQTLIRNLSDPQRRPIAEQALRERGSEVVPALLAALEENHPAEARRSILRLLLQQGEKRAEPAFRQAVRSEDEDTRAIGARGLFLLNAPGALEASLSALNDSPDFLHSDITPAVSSLVKMGMAALPAVLPLLDAPDAHTRMRAQRVFEGVTREEMARRAGVRLDSELAHQAWRKLWAENGSYRFDASPEERRAAIKRWRDWLKEKKNFDFGA